MSRSPLRSRIVLELAEEFLDRCRRGQSPSLKESIDRHPSLADEIREVFAAMAPMERITPADETFAGDSAGGGMPPPERLGDYRIVREIGRGGMGVVYEAQQISLGRKVALKLLPPQFLRDAKQRHRFEREARAAARLHHTNIVPVFGVGEHERTPYYVMQFIEGRGLDEVLGELMGTQARDRQPASAVTADGLEAPRRQAAAAEVAPSLATGRSQAAATSGETTEAVGGPAVTTPGDGSSGRRGVANPAPATAGSAPFAGRPSLAPVWPSFPGHGAAPSSPGGARPRKPNYWQGVARIGVQVAEALDYAHQQGILHRDIKPSNLLLDARGTVWVTDFGLAKASDQPNLTGTGDILGTLRYMPPEAFEGKSDARGDVYSLGLTLYELLALRPAFREKDRGRLIRQVTTGESERLGRLNPQVPRDLETIVHKAIEREPAHRYATAGELAADLQRFLDDQPIRARRTTPTEQLVRWSRRNPWLAAVSGTLTAVLIAVAAISTMVAQSRSRLADRLARLAFAADLARQHEAAQRELAEEAQRQAQASAVEAEAQRRRAEAGFGRARRAVDDSLTKVSESRLLDVPGLQPLRLDLLKSALAFYEEFLQERAGDAAIEADLLQTRLRAGRILAELGRGDDARAAFRAAAAGFEQALRARPEDPDLKAGLAMALDSVATHDAPNSAEARMQALRRPIALLEEVVAARPGASRPRKDLADYYSQLGRATSQAGRPAESSDAFERCVTLWLELADRTPDDPDVVQGLAQSLDDLALSPGFRGSESQRVQFIRQALELARRALTVHPNDDARLRAISTYAVNLARCLWDQGRKPEAAEELKGAVALLSRKARENPAVSGPHTGHWMVVWELAYRLNEWGRTDEATGVVRQAFALAETLARENPEAIAAQKNLIDAACDAAGAFYYVKRPDEAGRCLMAGRAALDRIPRETGDGLVEDATTRLRFAELIARGTPEPAATERAAWEELVDQAAASLRRAAAAGWHDAARLRTEAIFEPIRGRPGFSTLLAAVEAGTPDPAPPGEPSGVRPSAAMLARSPEIRLARARILAAIGQIRAMAGRADKGLDFLRQAIRLQQELVAERPADAERRAELAGIYLATGKTLDDLGRADSAIEPLHAARGLYEGLGDGGASRGTARFRAERLATDMALGRAYAKSNRPVEGAAAWDRAQSELTRAIEEGPEDPQRWIDRALLSIRRRRESLAASDLERAWSLEPGAGPSPRTDLWAALTLYGGDGPAYRRGCRRLLERFGQTRDARARLHLAITVGLGDGAVDDWGGVLRNTQETVNRIPAKRHYHYHDLALVCLRAGRFQAALQALDESDRLAADWPARTLNDAVRAIVCHRLGHHAEARSALEKARRWAEHNAKNGPPDSTVLDSLGDWYRHMVALREAEALIADDSLFPADAFAR